MTSWSGTSSNGKTKKLNYRVRFRHGVFPDVEQQATRQDIKKYDYFFDAGQTWIKTPHEVDFVHETSQMIDDIEKPLGLRSSMSSREIRKTSSRSAFDESVPSLSREPRDRSRVSARSLDRRLPTKEQALSTVSRPIQSERWEVISYSRFGGNLDSELVHRLNDSCDAPWSDILSSEVNWSCHDQSSLAMWPLNDPHEHQLFQFWIEHVADWFDVLSPYYVFRNMVPAMALQNTMLLNAVLLLSAQHIKRFDHHFPARPYMYHERLLRSLIPDIAEKGAILDEGTLMAAMLLRCFEEHHAGSQVRSHLSAIEFFQGPSGWRFDMSRPVVQACLMMHVHDEVCHGLLHRSELRIDYETATIPGLLLSTNDIGWRNQIVWRCGQILQKMNRGHMTVDTWRKLTASLDDWEAQRPRTFDSSALQLEVNNMASCEPGRRFQKPCHADAFQHLQVCRLALLSCRHFFDEKIAGVIDSQQRLNIEQFDRLQQMIAVARCNASLMSLGVTAAYAIHAFGTELQGEASRQYIVGFLHQLNASGWPTTTTVQWLVRWWYGEN